VLASPRVLIVDAPEEQLAFCRSVIGALAEVTAWSGTEPLPEVLQQEYALILVNLTAPGAGHDPRDTVRRIRAALHARGTPLVLIGGTAAGPTLEGIAGPLDYLPAPVVADALRAKVRLFVDLQVATAELAQLNERFLATMLHELRTPLNAILGWSTLLRTGRVDAPTTERALETIERNARAQTHLIDEMLDLSRIVAGKVHLELAEVDPRRVVESALATVTAAANDRRITLTAELADPIPPVRADFARLQQVVCQLLSNAIRFTPEGGQVTLRLDRAAGAVQITITDTGPGIATDLLPQLFDRFGQEEGATGRRHSGRGLGLTIVRRLVDLHGATVTVDSPGAGQGATFTIRLAAAVTRPAGVRS
jgi:signal transduction histidine kinase